MPGLVRLSLRILLHRASHTSLFSLVFPLTALASTIRPPWHAGQTWLPRYEISPVLFHAAHGPRCFASTTCRVGTIAPSVPVCWQPCGTEHRRPELRQKSERTASRLRLVRAMMAMRIPRVVFRRSNFGIIWTYCGSTARRSIMTERTHQLEGRLLYFAI